MKYLILTNWVTKTTLNGKINEVKSEIPSSLFPKLAWINESRIRLRFEGGCLRQEFPTFTPKNTVNSIIVFESDRWSQDVNTTFSLKNCLFGAVKLTKNSNPNKYFYSRYAIGFDSHSLVLVPNFDWSRNVITFGTHMSLSVHANNKNKKILVLGNGEKKILGNTSLQYKSISRLFY